MEKKSLLILTMLVLCLVFSINDVESATYYLDAVNGNDAHPGTSSQPWKTMARAMTNWVGAGTKVAFGDTVYLRTGNYGDVNFTFAPPSPSPTNWDDAITYKTETGQSPVFSHMEFAYETKRYLIFDGIAVTRTHEELPNATKCIYVHSSSALKFKNMNITGHWDDFTSGRLTSWGMLIDTVSNSDTQSDILIENCNVTDTRQGIMLETGKAGKDIVIRNNVVHHTSNSSIGIGANTRVDKPNVILVEGNYCYDVQSAIEWYTISHDNSITGTFNDQERVTQDISGALGKISDITTSTVQIVPLTSGWTVGDGYDIVGDVTGARLSDPIAITHTEYSHASGIGLTTDNVTVRGNIIRNYAATSPLHTYPGWITVVKDGHRGFNNITIENNLVYDPWSTNPTLLQEMNSNNLIRNNTFVGFHLVPPNKDGYYYRSAFEYQQLPESSGNQIYGNIVVGIADLCTLYPIVDINQTTKTFYILGDYTADFLNGGTVRVDSGPNSGVIFHINGNATYAYPNTRVVVSEVIPSPSITGSLKIAIPTSDCNEDYNLFYSVLSGGGWATSLKGTHTQILSNGSTCPQTFESGFFVSPNYSYQHGQLCNYQLQSGALAVNFGDPAYAPTTDILGRSRDASPDAGCYEYGAKPLKGDLNKDGQVNIQDVQACVNHILGKQDWGSAADVNGDRKVDRLDMQEIINIILGAQN